MAERFEITVTKTGARFPCSGDETVLSAMLRAHCGPVHHGCCGGGCGVCKAQVVKGQYHRQKPMSRAHVSQTEEEGGLVLLCCIRPESDMTITETHTQNTTLTLKEDLQ